MDAVSDSVRIAIYFFVNFDICKWLYAVWLYDLYAFFIFL